MGLSVFPPASTGPVNKVLKEKYFTADGTWNYPTSSAFNGEVEVTVVGGGGGSGGAISRANVNTIALTGAGGGGQVLSKEKISVLNLGNQTVKIGFGGGALADSGGLFGGHSSFGNDEVANFYTDPALANGVVFGGSGTTPTYFNSVNNGGFIQNISYVSSETWTTGTNPPQPPVGNTFVNINTSANVPITAEYVAVDASTSYRIGVNYHRFNTTGVVISPIVMWYTSNGEYISDSNLTGYTTLGTTGTWDQVVSTVTSPSTARYGRIIWRCTSGGADFRMTGIFVTKTSSNITTVRSGYSNGFKWSGQPNASFTLAENCNLVIAQGGGGGWGIGAIISGDGNLYPIPGQAGYTSGGKPISSGSTTVTESNNWFGGNGGGAGGSALEPLIQSSFSDSIARALTQGNSFSVRDNPFANVNRWLELTRDSSVSGGKGSNGARVDSISTPDIRNPFQHHGGPGEGIDGFGIGGYGRYESSSGLGGNAYRTINPIGSKQYPINRDVSYSSTLTSKAYYSDGVQNTGNGANGIRRTLNSSGITENGSRGGSGIVIVRWYE